MVEKHDGDMSEQLNLETDKRVPVFNLPKLLFVLIAALGLIHIVRDVILSVDEDNWVVFTFAFIPLRYVSDFSQQNYEWLWSPLTYSFLHGSYEHLIFNVLWLTIFAAPVLRRIGPMRFVLLFIASSAVSAFGYGAVHDWQMMVLVGASGVVSAMMGAACRFAFSSSNQRYGRELSHLNPRLSIIDAFRDRTVIFFVAMWLLGNLLVAFGIPLVGESSGNIAWEAHLFGFAFGFSTFLFFDVRLHNYNDHERV